MMLPAPRIIAIDDEPEHLEGLTRGLNRYGAACLPIHFTGEVAAIPSCPYVRVIFADLHLTVGPPGKHDQHFATLGGPDRLHDQAIRALPHRPLDQVSRSGGPAPRLSERTPSARRRNHTLFRHSTRVIILIPRTSRKAPSRLSEP